MASPRYLPMEAVSATAPTLGLELKTADSDVSGALRTNQMDCLLAQSRFQYERPRTFAHAPRIAYGRHHLCRPGPPQAGGPNFWQPLGLGSQQGLLAL